MWENPKHTVGSKQGLTCKFFQFVLLSCRAQIIQKLFVCKITGSKLKFVQYIHSNSLRMKCLHWSPISNLWKMFIQHTYTKVRWGGPDLMDMEEYILSTSDIIHKFKWDSFNKYRKLVYFRRNTLTNCNKTLTIIFSFLRACGVMHLRKDTRNHWAASQENLPCRT